MKIKVTGLINKDSLTVFSLNTNKRNPIIFTLTAIVGINAGVICETINSDVFSTFGVDYVRYIENSGFSFFKTTFEYALCNSLFIIAAMLLGVCAVGGAFLYFIPFFKGLGVGAACAYLYSAYGVRGVLYSSVIVFLPAVSEMVAIILACSESFLMSKEILSVIRQKENESTVPNIRLYALRYLIIFLLTLASAIIYSVMIKLFFLIAD